MRLLIAMMMHETNTFSPVPTDLQRFALGPGEAPPRGDEPGSLGRSATPKRWKIQPTTPCPPNRVCEVFG